VAQVAAQAQAAQGDLLVTAAQTLVAEWLREWGYAPVFEYRFCERQFRFDVAIPEARCGIEVDGYHAGRHGSGWGSDYEKDRLAQMLGWKVLRFSNSEVLGKKQVAYEFLSKYFA